MRCLALSLRGHKYRFGKVSCWGVIHGVLVSLVPILYVVWLLKNERIGDINMTKEERRGPYLVAVICASLASAIIYFGGGPEYLFHLSLLNILALGAMAAINMVWQISNHSTAIVSAMWVLGAVFDRWIAALVLPLVVIVCFARTLPKATHTIRKCWQDWHWEPFLFWH